MSDIEVDQRRACINGNFEQSINNNTNNYYCQGVRLEKSQIYTCLNLFLGSDNPLDKMDIKKLPAELNTKLQYNHAGKYINLFENYCSEIEKIRNIVSEDIPNGQSIVSTLKLMFENAIPNEDYHDDGSFIVNDGSTVLDTLSKEVKQRIIQDPRYDGSKLSFETVEKFVYAFLGYGVSECQVLLNPNK